MKSLPNKILMLGVGGMGMCPLAVLLKQSGIQVAGYDDALSTQVSSLLRKQGINVVDSIYDEFDLVIYSSAITEEHSFFQSLSVKGSLMMSRGEFLAKWIKFSNKKLIAVVGSHGKSTTTAMLIWGMQKLGLKFSYYLGALFNGDKLPAKFDSDSEYFIAEIDESDGTIDYFEPDITLVVNFDWDHQAKYKSRDALINIFESLIRRTKQKTFIPVDCLELPGGERYGGGVYKYSDSDSRVIVKGCGYILPQRGAYNAKNVEAALAVMNVFQEKVPEDIFLGYPGVYRRQTMLFYSENLEVFMDYAHHPAEIEAFLAFAREGYSGRIVIVFEPHRYSRTKHFYREFARVLEHADSIVLLPVYAASEQHDEMGTSRMIYNEMNSSCDLVLLIKNQFDISKYVESDSGGSRRRILFLGAGSIEKVAREYAKNLHRRAFLSEARLLISEDSIMTENEPLGKKTTLRVGGNARFYVEPATIEDLKLVISLCLKHEVQFLVLGRGSNVIISDQGFDGLVVRFAHDNWKRIKDIDSSGISVGVGVRLKELCGYACKRGLAGFEFLEGIPGEVGGALRMNAGAMGGWMFDIVREVTYLTYLGEVKTVKKEEMSVEYRQCEDLKNAIALEAVLNGSGTREVSEIRDKISEFSCHRRESQPREPSAGCIFKNPPGDFASRLIDQAGLKGERVGDAQVSEVHANFIINHGSATCDDVLELVRLVRERVHAVFGIYLEPEVLLVGESWENVLEKKCVVSL